MIAIEDWMGAHTEYSLNAPLSPPGVDVVDDFLFRSKLGWCEQIASSLVVLARSVGIPARLATGFAPGERDALTGRFVVRERDAHAWAEIYFAGIGWQGFDPTASVPLAGDKPASGSWMQRVRDHALAFGIAAALLVLLTFAAPESGRGVAPPPASPGVVECAGAAPARTGRAQGRPRPCAGRDAP